VTNQTELRPLKDVAGTRVIRIFGSEYFAYENGVNVDAWDYRRPQGKSHEWENGQNPRYQL
jgi:hypothetical protein